MTLIARARMTHNTKLHRVGDVIELGEWHEFERMYAALHDHTWHWRGEEIESVSPSECERRRIPKRCVSYYDQATPGLEIKHCSLGSDWLNAYHNANHGMREGWVLVRVSSGKRYQVLCTLTYEDLVPYLQEWAYRGRWELYAARWQTVFRVRSRAVIYDGSSPPSSSVS